MEKELLVELTVNEMDETGLDIISFVENPAIESNFMYFSKEKKRNFSAIDSEARIVVGAAMLANDKIVRQDEAGTPYFVYFSEATVRKCQELFFKKGNTKGTNVDHDQVKTNNGVTVIESWIVENPEMDKSKHLGYKDIPKGSWFVAYKVDDDELWDKIKKGEVQGFSVEGVFNQEVVSDSEKKKIEKMSAIVDGCGSRLDKILAINEILNIS